MPNILVVRNTYPDLPALKRVLRYVDKTQFLGGYAVDPDFAFDQMRLVKEAYHKTEGVQLKHFIVSFSNGVRFPGCGSVEPRRLPAYQ